MIYDVIIIGSGPAGLAAGVYAQRARLSSIIIEKEYMSGGQILNTYEVDNYPGLPGINGFDLGMKLREHCEGLGAEFVTAEVEKVSLAEDGQIKLVQTAEETYQAKTVILAMGARHRLLEVPGEEEFTGMGVSYCATCDGAFFKDRVTAVVGGGDVAVEDALFLARCCEKVYLIHRRDSLRAAAALQEKAMENEKIEILWDTVVTGIQGHEQVESIGLLNKKTGEERSLPVDGVFVAVGNQPNSKIVTELLHLDKNGYISADETGVTGIPGIFAAGDIRTKQLRQIVTAVSDGANAVTSVQNYLNSL
ncbi:MAG TPA: thioredoxin-disulfide reductase [Candidatus Choladousia intestinavium]|uniref:Thioredoxin reductase n=1 Tax=Candidatus Choladousia intestinavium TaxID=2840727 RepID=A0A9D1D8J3_9FIRM|nr:thioredoxin-disulfide reductase [Candidatus Choladousia intestinavium]